MVELLNQIELNYGGAGMKREISSPPEMYAVVNMYILSRAVVIQGVSGVGVCPRLLKQKVAGLILVVTNPEGGVLRAQLS